MKRFVTVGTGAVVGVLATAAYFLDPRSGQRRRAAVRRGSETVVRRSASVSALMGSHKKGDDQGKPAAEIRDALSDAVQRIDNSITVAVSSAAVTVRGEVDQLGQIAAVSRVIAGLAGDIEVVNCVRLRAADDGSMAAAG